MFSVKPFPAIHSLVDSNTLQLNNLWDVYFLLLNHVDLEIGVNQTFHWLPTEGLTLVDPMIFCQDAPQVLFGPAYVNLFKLDSKIRGEESWSCRSLPRMNRHNGLKYIVVSNR